MSRIAVTCGLTSQGFLAPVERLLREGGHEVQRFDGTSGRDIVARVQAWGADAIWHEWCDSIGVEIASLWGKRMIVRCHRYEVTTPAFTQIRWNARCWPVITSAHVIERALKADWGSGPVLIPSIVDFDAFPLAKPEPADALRLAVVGYFSGRKQPALAFEAARALAYNWQIELSMVGKNAGGEPWWEDYLHVQPATDFLAFLHPWTDDVKGIWKLNDACLSTSAEEGCPYNVIEAMASGVPAFVHRYPGSTEQFPSEFLWETLDDLKRLVDWQITSREAWSPEAIRGWAAERYSIEACREKVLDLFKETA